MRQTELILEVTFNPHLTDDVLVQREIHRGTVFDNKSRSYERYQDELEECSSNRIVPRQMRAVKTTVAQNVMVPNRIVTSSLKSGVEKNEYTIIHNSITRVDPTTTIQVIIVQLKRKKKTSKRFKAVWYPSKLTNGYSAQHKC